MYNGKYVIPGIVVFVALFTLPFWFNLATGETKYEKPKLAYPSEAKAKECVETKEWMLAEHMQLLNDWRDEALREGNREFVASTGKKYVASLQNTCMNCHANKAEFCDKCHDTMSVDPYCWSCHLEPKGNQ